jgi:hypothetical protein
LLTKIRRTWVGDIVDVSLGVFKVSLLEGNTDGQNLLRDSPMAFLPCMRLAVPLLVEIVPARRGSC